MSDPRMKLRRPQWFTMLADDLLPIGEPMIRRALMTALLATTTVVAAQAQTPSSPGLPPLKLVPARDSFFIMVNNKAVGTSIYSVTPSAAGFVIKENTVMPDMGVQVTEVTANAAGRPIKVDQTGKMGGQDVALTIQYANGRATGSAKVPGAPVIKIDAAVPANVVDDNTIQALLPRLPWSATAKWSVPVFSGGVNALATQELVVTDTLTVSIPSGKYPAYRAELRSANGIVAFYILKAAPHRILKIVPAGTPFEFVSAE